MTEAARAQPQISDAFLDDLRVRTNLPALVGRGVELRRSGKCWTGLCPFHGERNPSFAVYPNGYHCFGCGAHGDAIAWVMAEQRVPFLEAVVLLCQSVGLEPPVHRQVRGDRPPLASVPAPEPVETDAERASRAASAKAIWLGGRPIDRTPVEAYLSRRGIDLHRLERMPRALRYVPELWCEEVGRKLPAMVAAISGGDGAHVATHRTWLHGDRDGSWIKAPLDRPKKVLGRMAGGSIRLNRGASSKPLAEMDPDERVVIGEGIETCLTVAVACPEMRVLSAISLSGMGLIALPDQASRILLLADNDTKPAARQALQRVIDHHIAAGRDVRVARSPYGSDFNDAIR